MSSLSISFLGRWSIRVLAGELAAAIHRIGAVQAHAALGQRHAQLVGLAVRDLDAHADLLVGGGAVVGILC